MFCLRQYLVFTIITTCGRYVWFRSGDESSKVVFTSGQVYVYWIPVTTSSVTTSNRLLWANNFQGNQHLLIDHNVKKFSNNEHPGSTSTFLCIKLLVVSGPSVLVRKRQIQRCFYTLQVYLVNMFWNRTLKYTRILGTWISTFTSQCTTLGVNTFQRK